MDEYSDLTIAWSRANISPGIPIEADALLACGARESGVPGLELAMMMSRSVCPSLCRACMPLLLTVMSDAGTIGSTFRRNPHGDTQIDPRCRNDAHDDAAQPDCAREADVNGMN
jgi:hypothetical protein